MQPRARRVRRRAARRAAGVSSSCGIGARAPALEPLHAERCRTEVLPASPVAVIDLAGAGVLRGASESYLRGAAPVSSGADGSILSKLRNQQRSPLTRT